MFQSISRRTFLRGAGVALSLPLLDAMTVLGRPVPPRRRMVAVCTTLGMHTPLLVPTQAGRDYTATPYLEALAPFRRDLTVFSGLSHPDVDGGHSAEASFLTAAPHPAANGFKNSISLDQFAAERLGSETRFPSLILNTGSQGGSSLSWTRGGVMIPADGLPSRVFARLFFNGTPAQVRTQVQRLQDGQSIMDTVGGQVNRLRRNVGSGDRARLDQYFDSVREVERRLARAEEWAQRPRPQVSVPPPVDIADRADLIGRSRLMYDLIHLALQTDSTRLITLQVQGMGLVPPIPGVTMDHHNLSHHGRDPGKIAQLRVVEEAELRALGGLLQKLRDTREEGQTLLDRTMVLFGSNLGNASSHDTRNLPVLLAGGGFRHGQHLAFDTTNNTPLCNLYLAMLRQLGLEVNAFASSQGTLRGLEAA